MCCFSKASDKLSQWRGYADNASGVAIGFSRKAIGLTCDFDFELALMDVLYDKEEQIRLVRANVENTLAARYNMQEDKELVFFYKNPSFYEEEEVRLLYCPENDMKEKTFDDPSMSKYYNLMSKDISKIKYRTRKKDKIPYFEFDLNGTKKGFSSELIPQIVIGPRNRTDLEEIQELLKK